jgi:hypothetical protein
MSGERPPSAAPSSPAGIPVLTQYHVERLGARRLRWRAYRATVKLGVLGFMTYFLLAPSWQQDPRLNAWGQVRVTSACLSVVREPAPCFTIRRAAMSSIRSTCSAGTSHDVECGGWWLSQVQQAVRSRVDSFAVWSTAAPAPWSGPGAAPGSDTPKK